MGADAPAAVLRIALSGSSLEVPVRADVAEQLIERGHQELARLGDQRLGELLAYRLFGVLVDPPNRDNRPPTDAQLKYAFDLAARYGLEIPPEALKIRSAMGRFLSTHAVSIRSIHPKSGDGGN